MQSVEILQYQIFSQYEGRKEGKPHNKRRGKWKEGMKEGASVQ
jgi:hypothetical protein